MYSMEAYFPNDCFFCLLGVFWGLFLFFLQKDVFSHVCSLLSLRPLSTCVAITLSVNHKHTQLLSLHHNVSAAADKPEVIRVVVLP